MTIKSMQIPEKKSTLECLASQKKTKLHLFCIIKNNYCTASHFYSFEQNMNFTLLVT